MPHVAACVHARIKTPVICSNQQAVHGDLQGGSGVSAPEMQQMAPGQVPHVAASVHDSVNTVGSSAINKAIQQAQAQAQAHGVESQVTHLACMKHTVSSTPHPPALAGNVKWRMHGAAIIYTAACLKQDTGTCVSAAFMSLSKCTAAQQRVHDSY